MSAPPDDMPLTWPLDGKVALVTGASSGLGARFALLLRRAGATVIATARREGRLRALPDIETIAGDIADPAFRSSLVEAIRSRHARLDVLVNNAGIVDFAPLEVQSLAEITEVVQVNLVSVMDLCRLAAPLLFASRSASVVNVSSIYGVTASRGPMAAYNATKGAIVNLTRNLAAQWGARGVRVNALAPGYFPSEMTEHLGDPELVGRIKANTLLGRVPDCSELDGPLLFLASAASSYVTGHTLVVDAGWTAT
jgi:NAD(P)-dependent dehydrogenase (short-subunit alcohol dehydrogenase family)